MEETYRRALVDYRERVQREVDTASGL
jgi:hypothetical protein